ncbi:hypothetical protein, partial [Mediterraneibacter gnavus]|uniref:hypothetical protein n=1 Tax=Mediterraneibacter gnavus TaxID=33038 RepID=UPI0022DF1218
EPIGEARVEGETQDRSSFFAAVGSQATIRPGTPHAYGSWNTTEFSVQTETGTHLGYCAEPNSPTPICAGAHSGYLRMLPCSHWLPVWRIYHRIEL